VSYYLICKSCLIRVPVATRGDVMLNPGSGEMRIARRRVRTTGVSLGPGGRIAFGPRGLVWVSLK